MRLACKDVMVSFVGAQAPALDGVSVDVTSGELVLVVGPSGSGKSTLMMALAALMRPDRGELTVDGDDVWAGDVAAFRRRLGVLFQFPERQLFGSDVQEEIGFASVMAGAPPKVVATRVRAGLDAVGLDERFLGLSPFGLSGGEQRRVALAAALASEPEILLLDEPTAGLDAGGRDALLELLRRLVDEGRGALIVSHDAAELLAVADRAILLEAGRVAWQGPAVALRTAPSEARRLGLALAAEDMVAATLRERGYRLDEAARWSAASLARAIAWGRP